MEEKTNLFPPKFVVVPTKMPQLDIKVSSQLFEFLNHAEFHCQMGSFGVKYLKNQQTRSVQANMSKSKSILSLLFFWLLAACTVGSPGAQEAAEKTMGPIVEVYRTPT